MDSPGLPSYADRGREVDFTEQYRIRECLHTAEKNSYRLAGCVAIGDGGVPPPSRSEATSAMIT